MKKILYLVSRSPFQRGELRTTLRLVKPGDGVALLQCGVTGVGGLPPDLWDQAQVMMATGVTFYALKEDLEARGMDASPLGAEVVDYDGMLELFERYEVVVHS
jgi:tRNA 2-thiouridine synthesizing protein B